MRDEVITCVASIQPRPWAGFSIIARLTGGLLNALSRAFSPSGSPQGLSDECSLSDHSDGYLAADLGAKLHTTELSLLRSHASG